MADIKGACFCGQTTFTVTNARDNLIDSVYCHCSRCQRLNGSPFIWTSHWKEGSVEFHSETDSYAVVSHKHRLRCKNCGAQVGTWNEKKKQWSLWPVHFQLRDAETNKLDLKEHQWLKPTAHIFYDTRLVELDDGLPKYEGVVETSNLFA